MLNNKERLSFQKTSEIPRHGQAGAGDSEEQPHAVLEELLAELFWGAQQPVFAVYGVEKPIAPRPLGGDIGHKVEALAGVIEGEAARPFRRLAGAERGNERDALPMQIPPQGGGAGAHAPAHPQGGRQPGPHPGRRVGLPGKVQQVVGGDPPAAVLGRAALPVPDGLRSALVNAVAVSGIHTRVIQKRLFVRFYSGSLLL